MSNFGFNLLKRQISNKLQDLRSLNENWDRHLQAIVSEVRRETPEMSRMKADEKLPHGLDAFDQARHRAKNHIRELRGMLGGNEWENEVTRIFNQIRIEAAQASPGRSLSATAASVVDSVVAKHQLKHQGHRHLDPTVVPGENARINADGSITRSSGRQSIGRR